jgi:hypothetical protein
MEGGSGDPPRTQFCERRHEVSVGISSRDSGRLGIQSANCDMAKGCLMKIAGAVVLAVNVFAAFYVLFGSFAVQRRMEVKRSNLELALKRS